MESKVQRTWRTISQKPTIKQLMRKPDGRQEPNSSPSPRPGSIPVSWLLCLGDLRCRRPKQNASRVRVRGQSSTSVR